MSPRTGTVVFFDLTGFSISADPIQASIANAFKDVLKDELTRLFQKPPARDDQSSYLVLPTGDGAAVILWDAASNHPRREFTALWLAGKILVWAQAQERLLGIRCGINSGELDLVNDIYETPNVCGAVINVAQRIMDAAQPGQLLVRDETFAQRLSPVEENQHPEFHYHLEPSKCEVLAKHNFLINVRSVTGTFINSSWNNKPFGNAQAPANKWHLQIEPPILHLDSHGVLIKKPPVKLLLQHRRIAFVGATNDQLASMFKEALQSTPDKSWDTLLIFFLADEQLGWMATPKRTRETLAEAKRIALSDLKHALVAKVKELKFLEYSRPFYFASYWDWNEPGGRIHISPYIWGADVKICPALDYTWITRVPTPQYQAYVDGLQSLQNMATRL